ncbi:MAG TPA: PD-(D/E)XK nuclease family protein, partial [Acidimicrobiales bacterium]|nr:PD-(D/E)XK nuclease family protein [Acidimicrobiales bacterium]
DRTPAAARRLADPAGLSIASIRRSLLERARRCSFSSLVSPHDAGATLDASIGDRGADDEDDAAGVPAAVAGEEGPRDGATAGAVPAPLESDPFDGLHGATFGTAVHEALEVALRRDAAATFDEDAAVALDDALRRHGIAPSPTAAAGLLAAAAVPIAGGASLRELRRDDAATELRFSMPVAEGVDLAAVATALAAERDGPFARWATTLAREGRDRPLAASLVGSIDLVTTLGGGERHHVVDYKTNLVDPATGYGRAGLLAAMRGSDYPLQAAIYLVALHRLLRWRLADYDPARHLGDAHYLYLRGMGARTGEGVCTWSPGPAAVVALSDLLAGTS